MTRTELVEAWCRHTGEEERQIRRDFTTEALRLNLGYLWQRNGRELERRLAKR